VSVVRRIRCVVRNVIDHGEGVYTVELEPSIPVPLFKPGQFLHLALDDPDDGFWPESRVFSIASSPQQRDRLQITYAVKGAFTTRMERELTSGRSAWIKMPYGDFVIESGRAAVLVAGGTGVTPFVAFLRSLPRDLLSPVLLLYGARTEDLFVYRSVAESRSADVPALTCRFVCEETGGRLSVDQAWPLIAGLRDPDFYLSGPPAMLTALTQQLLAREISADRIRIDAWE
jgi:ferredoxin-NADP reductase